GSDQSINTSSPVQLDGSLSTDPDSGDVLTYAWEQTGGTAVTLSSTSAQKPTFTTPASASTLTFSLTVDDQNGGTATDSVTIDVPDRAPVADAGLDRSAKIGDGVMLDGSSSADPDSGDTLSYAWVQIDGTPLVTLSSNTVSNPTFTVPSGASAVLTFRLTVSDGTLSSDDTVTVSVGIPPVANAGPDQLVNAADLVTLDGSESSDPNDHTLTYKWTQTGGSATVTLSDDTAVNPTFTAPATSATLTFKLTVSNGTLSAWDSVTITVNRPPVADAGSDQTVNAGVTVFLDGSNSSDPDHDPLTYKWTQTSGSSVTLSGNTDPNPSFAAPANAATLTFQLVVKDGRLQSVADSVTITVTPLADMQITKTDGVSAVDAASTVTYTLGVTNAGPSTAHQVAVTDALPSGTSFVSASGAGWSCGTVSPITCTRTSLDSGATAPAITLELTAPPQGGSLSNTASVAATEPDPISNNDSATDIDTVIPVSDLQITKSDGVDSVSAGSTVTYTLGVSNAGPSTATSVTVTDALPSGTSFVSASGAGWTCGQAAGTVTCTRSLLSVGAAPAITLKITAPNQAGSLVNTASVSAPTDLATGNNSDTDTDTVVPVSDLQITKSDGVGKVDQGSTVSYTIVASNAGPSTASNAVFKDATVGNLSVSSVTCGSVAGGGVCPTVPNTTVELMQNAGIVIPTLPVGGSVTFTVTGTAGTGAGITNTATLDPSSGTDPSPATATDTDAINRVPVANAGLDQGVNSRATNVTLDGSLSSDPDTDSLTYTWVQTDNGGAPDVTLSNSHAARPTFTAPAGNHTLVFSLTVNDGRLTSEADTVTITVTDRAPVADAGPDQGVSSNASVTLDGSGSTDPDGDSLTYNWAQTSGPAVTLSSATAQKPTFTAPAGNRTLVFSLTVNDGTLNSSADTVTIGVGNHVPIANAGPDQPGVNSNATNVTLDGSGSTDPDGDSLSYTWAQTDNGGAPAVTLSDAHAAKPTFTAPAGTHTLVFSLTVNDGTLDSAADTVTITVTNRDPTANAGLDQPNVNSNASVTLDGSGNDQDGDSLTYTWVQTDNGGAPDVTLSNSHAAKPTFTAPAGNHTLVFSLTVDDQNGGTATDTVTITVTNRPPVANAGPDQGVNSNATGVTLDGSASSDQDGDHLTYAWTQTSGPTVSLSDATAHKPTFTAPAGTHTLVFSLTVDDQNGGTATDTVTITVANRPPVANAGPDQGVNANTKVTLDGSASSDPDHDSLTYAWTQVSGPAVTLSGATAQKPTFTAPAGNQTLVFSLIVHDGFVPSPADTVTVGVGDRVPVANAGPDQSVNTGASVTLDGSKSSDPDGDALTYKWTQSAGPTVALSSTTAAKPTFTAPAAATSLTFKLTVSDGTLTGTDEVTVAVQGSAKPAVTKPAVTVAKRPQTKLGKAKISSAKHMASFKFSGSLGKGKLSFQCKLDKGKYKSCRSAKTYKNLKHGKHVFSVRAKDTRGWADLTPAVKRFKI
ncbi:MAG: PKD domain-containing protein, partial [Gaiellaceae bacterium]